MPQTNVPKATHHFIEAAGVRVFYRESGPTDAPVVLLLHGFPTSSFQYRELIPRLADNFRVIAPDLPGFGFTEPPPDYTYTFASIAKTILAFNNALKLKHYAMYVFDYGAPTGFRLGLLAPERVTAIVSQNGNAYAAFEGFTFIRVASRNRPTSLHTGSVPRCRYQLGY